MSSWTLDAALAFVRRLEECRAEFGDVHFGLTGSVLFAGESTKDVDVVVYPDTRVGLWDFGGTKAGLAAFCGAPLTDCGNRTPEQILSPDGEVAEVTAYRDDKAVSWLRLPDGRRVDFFFLQ